jgi:hypothetical protein
MSAETTGICDQCGKLAPGRAKFCPFCGASLKGMESPAISLDHAEAPDLPHDQTKAENSREPSKTTLAPQTLPSLCEPNHARSNNSRSFLKSVGKAVSIIVVAVSICTRLYLKFERWSDQQKQEHYPAIVAGLKTVILPRRFVRDDVSLENGSAYPLTNIKVSVIVLQHGQQIDQKTLTLDRLDGGKQHIWSGVLWIPDGEVGKGTMLTVSSDELLTPQTFTY